MAKFGSIGESGSGVVVLIGDVVGSRNVDDRAALQETLKRLVGDRPAAGDGAAPRLELTAGDEIQGLAIESPEPLVDEMIRFTEALHPLRMCFGLGRGTLFTPVEGPVAHMDGPCFHRARRAVDRARHRNGWAAVEGFGAPADQVLDALFDLMGTLRARWTVKQAATVREARRHALRKEVAARLQVSPSVVTESLQAAAFDSLREGETAVRALLAGEGGGK